MLHHEFEALIGRKATDEEYTRANGIYMNINMTKEKFCDEWETVKDSKILKELRQCQADWKMISEHKTTLMKSAGHATSMTTDASRILKTQQPTSLTGKKSSPID